VPTTNPNEIVVTEVTPGGPYSFDPAIDYDTIGFEELINCYETLLAYNGSSDTEFVPMVTTEIPTVANGGISSNYLNYTFNIRSGLKFSNGDPVTAWDVYASMVRTLLFVDDSPGTAGWILAQDLLPGGGFVGNATSYQNITSCMTLNNASQAVTFHLLKPDSAFLFYFANPEGTCITDYSWLVAHGAGITFTPAGFAAYISQGNETGYNNYIRYDIMGSGPYMIKNYLIGESVVLVPNPYYTPIAGYMGYNHPANDTIYIQWEKDPSTALVMAESGQTDFFWGLPDYDYPILAHLAAEGKIINLISPLLAEYWYQFNVDINTTMLSTLGTGFHIPQYYFANLDVRRAFAYAFNYTNYVDNLLGNSIYGADFGDHHTGIIPKGMGGYMTDTQLQQVGAVVPVYNLTIAKQYMEESGEYNISVNMPIIVSAGDPVDFAGAEDWGSTLSTIDPNIVASALYIESPAISGYTVPDQNPMPIALELWGPDYPFPSDYVVPMYLSSGYFVSASGFAPNIFAAAGYLNESQQDAYMCQLITNAESTGNSTLALKYIDQAQVIAVNLTIDVYLYQINDVLSYSPSIHGFENDVNTMSIGNCYIYLTKT
jgi:ABC-type transport system substrate-binding protein